MAKESKKRLSGFARLRSRRRRTAAPGRVKNYTLIGAIVLVFSLGIYLAGGGRELLRHAYSHFAILLLVFLIIEYIVLKGRDRSRIYRIERDQARAKRREDMEFLRETGEEIERIRGALQEAAAGESKPEQRERTDDLTRRLDALQRRIAQRI